MNLGNGDGTFATATHFPFSGGQRLFAGNFLGDSTQSIVDAYRGAFFQNLGGTAIALTASAQSSGAATIAVQITPTLSGRPAPTGSGTLSEASTRLATVTITNGGASIAGLQLTTGPHSLTFAYSGDANFQPNTTTVRVTIAPPAAPDFSVSSSASSLTIARGQTGTATLTVTPNAALTGTVSFACSGLPAGAACQFSPASITATNQPAQTTLTITTTAASAAVLHATEAAPEIPTLAAPALALVLLPLLRIRQRGRGKLGLLLVVAIVSSFTAMGCGGSSSGSTAPPASSGTPAGSYTVVVTATAGSTTHTLPINITVQ